MKVIRKSDGSEIEIISYGKIKQDSKWLNVYTGLNNDGSKFTQICECIDEYFEPKDEESQILFKSNDILIKDLVQKINHILAILLKQTDPEELDKENFNDFIMNIIANLVAKSLEKILKI